MKVSGNDERVQRSTDKHLIIMKMKERKGSS